MAAWVDVEWQQYVFLILSFVFLLVNLWVVTDRLSSWNEIERGDSVFYFSILCSFLVLVLPVVFPGNYPFHMLYPIRFVESPQESSWYILHNDSQPSDGKQEVGGISKEDLTKLKEIFSCQKVLSLKENKKQADACEAKVEQRENALYGYMAWNLGNTKVFCPASVRNDKGIGENGDIGKQCLVINGQFLQEMQPQYISIPSNGK